MRRVSFAGNWSFFYDKKIGYRMINTRAENVAEKPTFRAAFKRRRCLVPASGFYEWQQKNGKQTNSVCRYDGRPFAFEGPWERWEGNGETVDSCTIIIPAANDLTRPIHECMPVVFESKVSSSG